MESCPFDKLFTKSVPHILEKIFLSLDYETFKKCREVSNAWNEQLTSESYQQKAKSVFTRVPLNPMLFMSHDVMQYLICTGTAEAVA